MWYTPVSGIWQTVWIESVPEEYITSVNIRTGKDFAEFSIEGISEVTADHTQNKVTVVFASPVDDDLIIKAITDEGYEVK